MSEGVIAAIIGLLGVPISLLIGWIINRKRSGTDIFKNITESSTLSVDASQAAVELMQTTMETLSRELNAATVKIDQLQREISELRSQNLLLLQENHVLRGKIDDLSSYIDSHKSD